MRGGFVQPVNLDLVASYPDIFEALKNKPYNTVDGVALRRPARPWLEPPDVADRPGHSRRRPRGRRCSTRPDGYKISVYDAPIYIADAAVVLMATKPELGITNPYALDETQFAAAVDLLKQQKPAITEYWVDYAKQMDDFTNGNVQRRHDLADHRQPAPDREPAVPVEVIKPSEGATGWSDTWMINSKTKNLELRLQVDRSPDVAPRPTPRSPSTSARRPATRRRAPSTVDPNHCTIFHADDDAFWEDVWYWQTPTEDCVDGRTDVKCKGFDDWIKAWTEIKG